MDKLEINKHLPFGTTLQDVLKHPSLTDTKLKYLLRQRGIYLEQCTDVQTFPLLLSTLLSPLEFQYIQDAIRKKEDTKKTISRTLPWYNEDDLITVIPDKIDLKGILSDSHSRHTITKQSNFAPVDGDRNKVRMTFTCLTNNYNSSWYRTRQEYDGEIILEKTEKNGQVYFRMVYTSPETFNVADVAVKELVRDCKAKGYTKPDSEFDRILYNKFNNEARIAFFLSLTDGSDIFEFVRTTDIEIAPDRTVDMPAEISKLMTGKVNTLKINGESLHENYLISEKSNHKYLELAEIEALYNFSYHAAEGNCVVRFGFNGYFRRRISNIEFSIDVSKVNLKDEYKQVNKDKVREFLLQEFEKLKIVKYNNLKSLS